VDLPWSIWAMMEKLRIRFCDTKNGHIRVPGQGGITV
jgi:hypothetical protein